MAQVLRRLGGQNIVHINCFQVNSFLSNNNSMQERKRKSSTTDAKRRSTTSSPRTKKQIAWLPDHVQAIYKKAHANALEQYLKPEKRRGGKRQSVEQVAHMVAWAAVKKKYEKKRYMGGEGRLTKRKIH